MTDKKNRKAKSKNLPRRQRMTKSVSVPGSRKKASKSFSRVAVNTSRVDPTRFAEGPISHRTHGRGMRFVGVQVLQKIVTTASDSQLWTGTAPAVAVTNNAILLNPDTLNGRLAVYANSYARYAFRSIRLEFEPLVATSQAGGCALAIVNDPQYLATAAVIDYTTIQDITPSVSFPFRERGSLSYKYDGDDLFFTEFDNATTAATRQTVQAVLIGYPSSSSIGAVTQGTIRIHYVIDMFQPVNTLNISLSGLTVEEKNAVRAYAESVRAKKAAPEQSDKTLGEHKDLMEVPMTRQNTVISQSTSSVSSASSSSVTSGYRAPSVNEQYVLVSSLKH